MKIVLVTGSCGLVGSESCIFFAKKGFKVIGIDNNLRKSFFGCFKLFQCMSKTSWCSKC